MIDVAILLTELPRPYCSILSEGKRFKGLTFGAADY